MRRLFPLVLIAALAVSACASSGGEPTSTSSDQGATTTSVDAGTASTQADTTAPTSDEGASTTSSVPDVTETTSGRPAAPDFSLDLGDGGTYTLSDGAKPVYLVFWAEW